ncbi:MAG: hypothetical protein A3K67_06020 [Euryarchaeota archaeon RBG_16_62_10]|nr:MAG: hypothetical protein A3K67_06020 [Euryarchaeota archaeon RBG_16_62_10]
MARAAANDARTSPASAKVAAGTRAFLRLRGATASWAFLSMIGPNLPEMGRSATSRPFDIGAESLMEKASLVEAVVRVTCIGYGSGYFKRTEEVIRGASLRGTAFRPGFPLPGLAPRGHS